MKFKMRFNKFLILLFLLSIHSLSFTEDLTLSLEEAMIIGLGNSSDLHLKNLNLETSRGLHAFSIRSFLPLLDISYTNADTVAEGSNDTYSKKITFKLTQPIIDGGRNITRRKLAKLQLLLEGQQIDNLTQQLMDQIWQLYHDILITEKKQTLQLSIVEMAHRQLEIAELQHQQGSITRLDFIESKISTNQFQSSINQTEVELAEKMFQMKSLLELDPAVQLSLKENDDVFLYSGLTSLPEEEQLFRIAVQQNLELKSSEFEIIKQKEELFLTQMYYIPTISANFSYSISGVDFPLQQSNYDLGLTIAFPLNGNPMESSLSFGSDDRNRSRSSQTSIKPLNQVGGYLAIKQKELSLSGSLIKERKMRENLRFQIRNFLEIYEYKKQNLSLERESISLEQEKLDILSLKLKIGEIKLSDFLKAQTEFSEKQIKLLSSILDIFQTERTLENTLGLTPGSLQSLSRNLGVDRENTE